MMTGALLVIVAFTPLQALAPLTPPIQAQTRMLKIEYRGTTAKLRFKRGVVLSLTYKLR